MGSRAVIVLCKDVETAAHRFKVNDGGSGIIYTRTGRRFFENKASESEILARLQTVLTKTNFWDDLNTDWVCLDTELMPWSAKAQKLLEEQYAPVGRAGRNGLAEALASIQAATATINNAADEAGQSGQGIDLSVLLERYQARRDALERYTDAYRRYCWDVKCLDDYRIAPFHILAMEGKTLYGENHIWHMEAIEKYIAGIDPVFMATGCMSACLGF